MNCILELSQHNFNLCPERNSWEEFTMLTSIIGNISRAIDIDNELKIKQRLNRKRKISECSDISEDETVEEREIKRLKNIQSKLKRKYQEMLYN